MNTKDEKGWVGGGGGGDGGDNVFLSNNVLIYAGT